MTFSHNRIKKLSPLLINQLAAGEVVTRPATVVKELIENAIDAQATLIEIRITQGGMGLIEVQDNGCGILAEDMVMAVTRHATSKVADVASLQGIETLGFRGEALASIAAVSRLTLTSSPDNSGIGRELCIAGILEDEPTLNPVLQTQGTKVSVKDLYFNVPARRGNLKSIATEFNHIENIVKEVALIYSDIEITLYHENKKRLHFTHAQNINSQKINSHNFHSQYPYIDSQNNLYQRNLLSRIEQALNIQLHQNAIEINVALDSLIKSKYNTGFKNIKEYRIHGWLWQSENRNMPKLIYINGRLIKDMVLSQQIRQILKTLNIENIENIAYILSFVLPNEWLNINIHPNKYRIKVHELVNIIAYLKYGLQNAILNNPKVFDNNLNNHKDIDFKPEINVNDQKIENKNIKNQNQNIVNQEEININYQSNYKPNQQLMVNEKRLDYQYQESQDDKNQSFTPPSLANDNVDFSYHKKNTTIKNDKLNDRVKVYHYGLTCLYIFNIEVLKNTLDIKIIKKLDKVGFFKKLSQKERIFLLKDKLYFFMITESNFYQIFKDIFGKAFDYIFSQNLELKIKNHHNNFDKNNIDMKGITNDTLKDIEIINCFLCNVEKNLTQEIDILAKIKEYSLATLSGDEFFILMILSQEKR